MYAQKTLKTTDLQLVERPALTVVGMHYRGKPFNTEIPKLWDKFGPLMDSVPQVVHPAVAYGVCRDMDMQTGEFDYLAAVEVESNAPVPAGMVRWEVAGGLYAMIPTTIPTIGDAYALSETLIPEAGYRRLAAADYELYDETFDPANCDSVLYICIPIEKA
jgi:predicted transcriptional regulator YdeE